MFPVSDPPSAIAHPWRAMWTLALPVMAEEFANLLVGYTDWWLAGRFLPGDAPKAAMSLVAYSLWLIPTLFSPVAIGALAITARYVGAGDRQRASHVMNQALVLGTFIAAFAVVLLWLGSDAFVRVMRLEPAAADLATRYLRIMAPVAPLIMLEQVASACLRGAGDTRTGLLVRVVVNLLNLIFSTGLVTGWGYFPKLGWEGLAVGTAIGHGGGGLILVALLIRGRAGLQLRRTDLIPDRNVVRRIVRIGLPGGVDHIGMVACHLVYASIVNRLGTTATAAHGLGIQIEALSYLPGSAFMVAAATLAGQSLGAKDPHTATRSVVRCWIMAMAIMSLGGASYYTFGSHLAAIFSGGRSDEVTILAGQLLKIVALGTPLHATLMVLTGGLRGAGDTRWPLLITFAGLAGVRLPLAAWMAWESVTIGPLEIEGLGWGVHGAWIAMVTDISFRAILVLSRFLHGGWRHATV